MHSTGIRHFSRKRPAININQSVSRELLDYELVSFPDRLLSSRVSLVPRLPGTRNILGLATFPGSPPGSPGARTKRREAGRGLGTRLPLVDCDVPFLHFPFLISHFPFLLLAPCRSCLVASNSPRELPGCEYSLKLAPSSPDNMTSQAKTSSTAASLSVPSAASPVVATPQFITSLVQSTVQANTTSLLSQLDRRIAAALKAQGAVVSAPGREIRQPAQHQAPPPITSTPVAPVSTTPSQNVPGEHACGDRSVRYNKT